MPRVDPVRGWRPQSEGARAWKWTVATAFLLVGSAAATLTLLVELFRSLG